MTIFIARDKLEPDNFQVVYLSPKKNLLIFIGTKPEIIKKFGRSKKYFATGSDQVAWRKGK